MSGPHSQLETSDTPLVRAATTVCSAPVYPWLFSLFSHYIIFDILISISKAENYWQNPLHPQSRTMVVEICAFLPTLLLQRFRWNDFPDLCRAYHLVRMVWCWLSWSRFWVCSWSLLHNNCWRSYFYVDICLLLPVNSTPWPPKSFALPATGAVPHRIGANACCFIAASLMHKTK